MVTALGWLLLLAAGLLSLPLAAALLDDPATEDWVLPVQLAAMAVLGGLVGTLVPGFVGGTTWRRLAVGAAYGLVAAVAGLLVFFLLLSGFDGA